MHKLLNAFVNTVRLSSIVLCLVAHSDYGFESNVISVEATRTNNFTRLIFHLTHPATLVLSQTEDTAINLVLPDSMNWEAAKTRSYGLGLFKGYTAINEKSIRITVEPGTRIYKVIKKDDARDPQVVVDMYHAPHVPLKKNIVQPKFYANLNAIRIAQGSKETILSLSLSHPVRYRIEDESADKFLTVTFPKLRIDKSHTQHKKRGKIHSFYFDNTAPKETTLIIMLSPNSQLASHHMDDSNEDGVFELDLIIGPRKQQAIHKQHNIYKSLPSTAETTLPKDPRTCVQMRTTRISNNPIEETEPTWVELARRATAT